VNETSPTSVSHLSNLIKDRNIHDQIYQQENNINNDPATFPTKIKKSDIKYCIDKMALEVEVKGP
jgi:hypothetical protein